MNRFQKNSLAGHLGIHLVEIGPNYLVATMPVDQRTKQPLGLLHGGASAVLIESLGGMAGWLCLDDLDNSSVVGIEINANHLRSAKEGMVIGTVRPVKVGRTMQVWTVDIEQEEKLLCTGRLTNMVIKK